MKHLLRSSLGLRGPWQFYCDFVGFPLLAMAIVAFDCRSWAWCGEAICGIALFTLLEYWVHRVVLHRFLYHGAHERHHSHPAEYVLFPLWATPAAFLGFFIVLPLPVFAGVILGYCWFMIWHHGLHHFDLRGAPRSIQRYALWHLAHHRDEDVNFGITTSLWDWVFGTYRA